MLKKIYFNLIFLLIPFFLLADNQQHQKELQTKEWSILICTLKEREASFSKIYNKLIDQIIDNGLEDKVEVLYFLDNRENSIGFKRNALMDSSQAEYVNFLDDDDDVHDNYIKMIYTALDKKPDVISLTGIITWNGSWSKYFIHSIKYNYYYEYNQIYYRPPNHLNTMKRSIASKFRFPDISKGEDTNWAMQIANAGLLKTEVEIKQPYYFYFFVEKD